MPYHLATYLSSDRSQGFDKTTQYNIFTEGTESSFATVEHVERSFNVTINYKTEEDFYKAWRIDITFHADYIPNLTPDDIHLH